MYKLTFQKRVWLVKQRLKGVPPSKLALAQGISEGMLRRIMRIYKKQGVDSLKDHKTGRPETRLNSNAEVIILDLRERFGYGACRIENLLKQKGFSISHRQIEKLLLRNGLVEPNIKKQKCRKWVRFEMPNPNDMTHTDWTYDPLGIKHYVAKVNRPQTNGKIERFFLTYKTEYATGSFSNLMDYIKHYNEHRPHMSLDYKTPKDVWDELIKRN